MEVDLHGGIQLIGKGGNPFQGGFADRIVSMRAKADFYAFVIPLVIS